LKERRWRFPRDDASSERGRRSESTASTVPRAKTQRNPRVILVENAGMMLLRGFIAPCPTRKIDHIISTGSIRETNKDKNGQHAM